MPSSRTILPGEAEGDVLATTEPLSFWGGVDPTTGNVIDIHHPLYGRNLAGRVLFMPTSRGSCTGSGVILDLVLSGRGPAALVFCESEDVLTLGVLIAEEMQAGPGSPTHSGGVRSAVVFQHREYFRRSSVDRPWRRNAASSRDGRA